MACGSQDLQLSCVVVVVRLAISITWPAPLVLAFALAKTQQSSTLHRNLMENQLNNMQMYGFVAVYGKFISSVNPPLNGHNILLSFSMIITLQRVRNCVYSKPTQCQIYLPCISVCAGPRIWVWHCHLRWPRQPSFPEWRNIHCDI